MRAWRITKLGQDAQVETISQPTPARGEVLLRVAACGLNFADLLMQQGKYQDTPALPFTPGMEFAGTIAEIGPDTNSPPIGARVAAFAMSGGLAEYVIVPANRLVPLPASMSFAELDARSNQLARQLLNQGTGADQIVAILLDRSPLMIVAMLATLKAGAAYLPLDPDLPASRLQFMLSDSKARLLLTSESRLQALRAQAADAA